jgi:hypothetical protein
MRTLICKFAVSATLGVMMGGAFAQAAPTLPPLHDRGNVEYLSGGIGLDESAAIRSASKQWPLTLEFAVADHPHADFVADVRVVVRDAKGHAALQATSDGPFLLAKLPPGRYTVDATFADQTLHEKVVVSQHKPARAVFVWSSGTGVSRS